MILLGHGENSIHSIEEELRSTHPSLEIYSYIVDIKNQAVVASLFEKHRPQGVFHAAAHKHVPFMEKQPEEAIKNNIWGTKVLAENALRYGTEKFVLISTDKAVNPTSAMGASKRMAELIVQHFALESEKLPEGKRTRFAVVRFGNVLGSRGSVIPVFKKQIARGGPVTVTHPDMERFFMTIPEAVSLVLQAGSMSKGGEVFVLDMGTPVKIVDLARDLIRLSGYRPNVDMEIKFTGIRPGEKLYEELGHEGDTIVKTNHERIMKITNLLDEEQEDWRAVYSFLRKNYEEISRLGREEALAILQSVNPGYLKKPDREIQVATQGLEKKTS
jgi:FlaA1/EpsC-like NDP-sugar epimerase